MKSSKFILIVFSTCLALLSLKAQPCIDYPILEAPVSASTTPPGWYPLPSPDVLDPTNSCLNPGPSPSGGNAAHFFGAPGFSEGIGTVVNGLTVGQTYNLLFWYFSDNCAGNPCCASLVINVDGMSYFFPPSNVWSIAEICVVPLSTSMTIELTSSAPNIGAIYVDDANCDDASLSCCPFEEINFDIASEYCQNYGLITLPTTTLEGVTGYWNIPTINTMTSAGQTFFLEFTPDDPCYDPYFMSIKIIPFVLPEFSFPLEYCREPNELIFLPNISDNLISGNWSINGILPSDWFVDILTLEFTPDDLSCSDIVYADIGFIDPADINFDLPDTLCQNTENYQIPNISTEGIVGNWDTPIIDFSTNTDSLKVIFDAGMGCFIEYEHTFYIADSSILDFEHLNPICHKSGEIVLDSITSNGIVGYWSIPIVNPDTLTNDTLFNLWTAISNSNPCINDTLVAMVFNDAQTPIFNLSSTYCALSLDTIFLNPISDNGIMGQWDTPYFIPNELLMDSLIIHFTPEDSICANIIEFQIAINSPDVLNFNLPSTFCSNQGVFDFPLTSIEGVSGNWLEPNITLSSLNGNYINYFYPDSGCYSEFIHNYEVAEGIVNTFPKLDTICKNQGLVVLNNYSAEGIEGSWSPTAINFDTVSSNSISAQWTPLDNLNGCILDVIADIEVVDPAHPTFDFKLQYCNTLSDTIFFPLISLESYNGQWDVPFIIPSQLNTNLVDIFFTPTDLECYAPTFIQIEILDQNQLNFDLKPDYCQTEGFIDLPNNSLEGVSGTWSTNPLDVSMLDGNQSLIFSPNEECTADYVYDFFVYTDTGISFDLPSTICRKDTLITLSPFSLENHEGIWNPNSFNPSLIMGSQIALEWEPIDDLNPCLDIVNIIIDITEPSIPSFSFDLDYCSLDADFVLPTSSDNGITGTWSIPTINPANYSNENINIIFTPSAIQNCVEAIDLDLFVAESINPIFNLPLAMCWDEAPLTLATISDNGISGSWNINEISPTDYLGQLIDLNFMPDDSACANGYVHQIQIIDEFGLNLNTTPPSNCGVQDASIDLIGMASDLEFSIDSGANWQAESCFKMLGSGTYNILIRSVSFPLCESTLQADISTLTETQIQDVIVQSLTDCSNDNGSIQIIADGLNLEFSIDGGNSWSDDPFFDMLTDGQYDIVVRSKNAIDCFDTGLATLTKPELPIINDVIVSNTSNCAPENGQVVIDMINSNFGDYQYSIDNGQNWQTDNTFNNLSAGDYTILIRLIDYTNCQIQEQVSLIEEDQDLSIPNYEIFQLSDCNATDGSIVFDDHFVQIDFSIDGGITWQIKPSFTNLPAGNYQVLLRARMAINCTNEINFVIDDLPCPCNDLDIVFNNTPVSCERDDNGAIEITNISGFINPNYQFNWADGNSSLILNNLNSGWYVYNIIYDDNCNWQDSIFIEELDPLNFGLQSFDESCPNANDGIIEIINATGGLEPYSYSIGGEVYQNENIFYNLSPAEYELFILDENNCIKTELIEIFENPGFEIPFPEIIPIELGETTFLNPLIDGSSIDSFSWTPQFGILNLNELIAEISPSETTEYTLTIYYDECIQERTILIEVIDNTTLYLGTAFSPNGDGSNDSFFIQSKETTNLQIQAFEVYDRWGNLVFQKEFPQINNPDHGWDGKFNGRNVAAGVFVYKIEVKLGNQNILHFGQLTVIY